MKASSPETVMKDSARLAEVLDIRSSEILPERLAFSQN
jgi:hypothetical protein